MDRIGGPQHVREGLIEALAQGVGVTAKVSWLTQSKRPNAQHGGNDDSEDEASFEGRPRWIHCTPLLGSDSKPGVIMIVMVDREEITGSLNTGLHSASQLRTRSRQQLRHADYTKDGWPSRGGGSNRSRMGAAKYTGNKLYADYLRREGQNVSHEGSLFDEARRVGEERGRMGMVNSGIGRLQTPSISGRSSRAGGTPTHRSTSVRRNGDLA